MNNSDKPAFHQATEWMPGSNLTGLTKRELLSAMAMQGFCSNGAVEQMTDSKMMAEKSLDYADALLKALES